MSSFEHAVFGNRDGSHQILSSSLSGHSSVLDELRFLVDRPGGPIGSDVKWSPYWGCQPLEDWWVLWRGEGDPNSPRKNMVKARAVLLPIDQCGTVGQLDELLAAVGHEIHLHEHKEAQRIAAAVVDWLAREEAPAIVPDTSLAPHLLQTIWPRLWTKARATFSLRTLFGPESLDPRLPPRVVVFPAELKARWRTQYFLDEAVVPSGVVARWFSGDASPQLERLLAKNVAQLPGDFSAVKRLERIVDRSERLHAGTGTVEDALLIVQTQESFANGFTLPEDDVQLISAVLGGLSEASIADVRRASLARLGAISDLHEVEKALERWVDVRLPMEPIEEALWVLEHYVNPQHAKWWRRAIGRGLDAGCKAKTSTWATALWQWWEARPTIVSLMTGHLDESRETEEWLANNTPIDVDDELFREIAEICRERDWAILLARSLGSRRPLEYCVDVMRQTLQKPEVGLDALLAKRREVEIVETAAAIHWPPLVARAVFHTLHDSQLLARTFEEKGFIPLLVRHLSEGGAIPAALVQGDFFARVFNGVIAGDQDFLKIADHLGQDAGRFVLDHPECEQLLSILKPEVGAGAVEEWWSRFLTDNKTGRPPSVICGDVLASVRTRVSDASIMLVLRLLQLFPEIKEADFEEWMKHTGFFWAPGDHQRVANVLIERKWKSAAKMCRRSWKKELVIVAWYARGLLSWFDGFWGPPAGVGQTENENSETTSRREKMKISFLAANPMNSERLALDEEARSIEEKIRAAKHRDSIVTKIHGAVRPEDLHQILLEDEPTVVHFSGHGAGTVGIVFHAENQSEEKLVAAEALEDLFRVLKGGIRVVVLNACYSEVQAKAIVKEIDFVVGMSESIGDEAARVFAAAFYRGLAFGQSVQTAFELGINELKLTGLNQDEQIPQLLVRSGVDATTTELLPSGICQWK